MMSISAAGLQASLAAGSNTGGPHPEPHHPLACLGPLAYHDDGSFGCEHATVAAGDQRTQHAVDQSIATLLIEMAYQRTL